MSLGPGYPTLDPEIAAIVASFPTPEHPPTIQESRASEPAYFTDVIKWQKENAPADSEYKVEDRMVPVDGVENLARCLIPTPSDGNSTQKYPMMIWFHGGGTAK